MRPEVPTDDQSHIGLNIRLLRVRQGMAAKVLAERIQVSPSLISKIETGASSPSMDVLRRIAVELHVSLSELVAPPPPPQGDLRGSGPANSTPQDVRRGMVALVRAGERRRLQLPSGIVYQLLTPDSQGAAEVVWVEMEPGKGGATLFAHRHGEELVLALEGQISVYLRDDAYRLQAGDCLTFDATMPHRYCNEGTENAAFIFMSVPPAL
jgi:transcriptional regulator with XRE-family HTH domain